MNAPTSFAPDQDRPLDARPATGRLRKLLVAALTFALVVAGWQAWTRHEAWIAPLPGHTGTGGACELWFIGSSTFGRWNSLEGDMTPWPTVNRGVNSARITDLLRRFRHEPPGRGPAAIVFYAGENDIAFGRNAGETFGTLERFVAEKERRYPKTPMILLSLKLAPKRVQDKVEHDRFDAAVRAMVKQSSDLRWIDVGPLTLRNGRPGPFFVADGIHLNPAGYALWRTAIAHALVTELPQALVHRCVPGLRG